MNVETRESLHRVRRVRHGARRSFGPSMTPFLVVIESKGKRYSEYLEHADNWSDAWNQACTQWGLGREETKLVMAKPFYIAAEGEACND